MKPATHTPLPVESPCINVCQVDGDDVCIGCGRTIDEIMVWTKVGDEEKRAIVDKARLRMKREPRI